MMSTNEIILVVTVLGTKVEKRQGRYLGYRIAKRQNSCLYFKKS